MHISLQINLIRRRTPVLLQTYLPSCLFVIVSWISFIVPPEIVPGKDKRNIKIKICSRYPIKKCQIMYEDVCICERPL